MELNRKPTKQEERLLEILVDKSGIRFPENWKSELLVRSMDKDGMGGLYLFPHGQIVEGRLFGTQISELQFADLDGVQVIASLYLDTNEDLFELDIWKTDFGKLLKFPDL